MSITSEEIGLTTEDAAIIGSSRMRREGHLQQQWAGDADRFALCNQFVHGHATCAAEMHAMLAFGRDIRE